MSQSRFYVSVNDVKLHFLEFGDEGRTVLVLPGITTPAILWAFVAERMAAFAHVFVLDIRGRGLSDQRPGLSYTLDDYADDAAGVVHELGLAQPVILGHSMGARIALRTAARHPEAVGSLLLADPPVSGPGRRPYPSPLSQYIDRMAAAARGESLPPSKRYTPQTPEQARLQAEWLPTCNREAVIATHRGFHEDDIFADMPLVSCPAHLLYAELGGTISDEDADEIVGLIPHATKQKLMGVGHLMPFFDLDLFVGAVQTFVDGQNVPK